ncbi:MAG: hypothetical protein JST85_28695 [Acidobacteria bacterium]|nr:hypothetical protein [Acidobacteriota bacterium]
MLTDKAKKREANFSDSKPSISSTSSPSNGSSPDQKLNNVLPLERPKGNTGKLRLPSVITEAHPEARQVSTSGNETTEIKIRMEAVLAEMKSRTHSFEIENTGAATSTAGSATEATNSESLGQEIERRKAAIIAIAREAEARSREAAEKFHQAEANLNEQVELRKQAEAKVNELEEDAKQWQAVAQSEELKRIEAEIARVELEERAKQETEARATADKARAQAETACQQAEAKARNAEEAYQNAEAKVRAAEEAARTAESLIYEADAIARQMEEKYKASETKLHREAELRALAEQMLQEMASLMPNQELSLENLGAPFAAQTPLTISTGNDDQFKQFQIQLETEQKARLSAEHARTDAESRIVELETKLRKLEEKFRTSENGYKKVLRKQEEELRMMSEQITRSNESTTSMSLVKSDDEIMFLDVAEVGAKGASVKLVLYGALISLLMVALVWLGVVAFKQL